MTDWITQEDWSTVELGDTIRVTSNGAMLTGEVVSIGINGHGSVGINSELLRGTAKIMLDEWSLSVPAKPAVELPTLAGVYYGSCFGNGVPFYLGDDGKWRTWSKEVHDPARHMPLTRLEPVAVTAKKVLDRLRYRLPAFEWFGSLADDICDEFGVTDE